MILLAVVAIFSLVKISLYFYDGSKSTKIYAAIEEKMISAGIIIKNNDILYKSKMVPEETLSEVFEEISSLNEDYTGYLYIADTNIQYPVVQGSDNEFYLTHDVNGQQSARGCLFMDYRNNVDFSDDNTLIYGHNMRDQSMFHDLMKYKDKEFIATAEPIIITTKANMLSYDVFAAYKVDKNTDYITINFQDEQAFQYYISAITARSDIIVTEDIAFGDRLLTLSTCENANNNYRYIVHAVLRR